MGPLGVRPGPDYRHGIRGVHLIDGRQLRAGQNGRDRAAAILGDGVRIVTRAVAQVEPGNDSARRSAASP
jgi:hypothetical protein